ncbi:hypothetical protein SAMN05518672_1011140 [Chitinophaga sp. CF118]|nr:hypothetical protein SAMN05518672_1011140 [Chitinophaga sp. CF118]
MRQHTRLQFGNSQVWIDPVIYQTNQNYAKKCEKRAGPQLWAWLSLPNIASYEDYIHFNAYCLTVC